MKTLKTILASLLVITSVQLASAQTTTIRIAGSNADRASVYQAIQDILQSGYVYGYAGTTLAKSNQAIFTGTTTSGNISVIIKTSFTGAVGGIAILASNLTVGPGGSYTGGGGWLVDSTPQSTTGTPSVPAAYDTAITADLASSDVFQKAAPLVYQTPKLHDSIVGVVPLAFVATPGTAALGTVTNVTKAQVKAALVNGTLKLSALSGNSGDTEAVLAVGRDEDSGARVQALACSGIGVQTALKQYQPLFDGNTTPTSPPPTPGIQVTGAALWPAVTLNSISYPQGDSGYSTGTGLVGAVKVPHSGSSPTFGTWFLSYFGIADAATITNGIQLDFNGVPYSAANVEGPGAPGFVAQYSFWGYEHIFYRTTLIGNSKTVATLIATDLKKSAAAVSGILLSNMTVSRDKDGGAIESGGVPGQ